ncbi:hypothetical protein Tco_0397050 [Tanacetum coccineum]
MSNTSDKGTTFGDGAARVGMQLRSSPKVSTSSPLVSPSTIINVPRELYSIDVAHTFRVPLTTVGDLQKFQKLINDIDAGWFRGVLEGGPWLILKSLIHSSEMSMDTRLAQKIDSYSDMVASPLIVATSNVVTPNAKRQYGFPNVCKTKKRTALNKEEKDDEEEDVENMYDESANLIQNTKAGGEAILPRSAVSLFSLLYVPKFQLVVSRVVRVYGMS